MMKDPVRNLNLTVGTVTAGLYAAKDLVGGKMSFDVSAFDAADGCMVLNQVLVTDLSMQSFDADLILFNANPSGTTFTNDASLDIADADLAKIVAVVPITGHHAWTDNGISRATGLDIPIKVAQASGSRTLYAALVARGAPTFTGTSDVSVTLSLKAAS